MKNQKTKSVVAEHLRNVIIPALEAMLARMRAELAELERAEGVRDDH